MQVLWAKTKELTGLPSGAPEERIAQASPLLEVTAVLDFWPLLLQR